MRRIIFTIAKRALIFFVAVATMLLLLIAAAVIPQDNIRTHMTETAEIMCEDNEIYDVIDFLQSSRIDHYADSVWLSIAFYLDENKPLESVVWSSYYSKPGQYANDELREAVQQNLEPNTEYLRYWHGPAGTLRFLHQFWNINQINNLHVVLMIVLYLVLMYVLIRHSFRAEAFAFSISMIAVSVWFVPLCLEYTYSFLCMLVASIIEVELALNRKYGNLGIFFMLTGMVTVYLDFLTTETLSLLIPLLLILRVITKDMNCVDLGSGRCSREIWKISFHSCVFWLIGYLGMWVMKWLLASFVLHKNVMPYVTGHIEERMGGAVTGVSSKTYISTAIIENLKCLFPYEYGLSGAVLVMVIVIVFVVLPVMLNRVTLRHRICKSRLALYAVLAAVPFIRFAVLHNHAYLHYFFTFRALASSVMALCFIALELVEQNHRKAVTSDA